ncbi:MAG: hypothetical protein KAU26_08165 [Methylococcales bacterium]|nr:hypothetical protein [Methylococcales bacterium]
MKEIIQCRGNIDLFKEGRIHGWAVTSELFEDNECDLFIDKNYISTFSADLYREDLKAESLRKGIAGFSTIVPIVLCDNKLHLVEIFKHSTKTKLHENKLILRDIPTSNYLEESIVFNHQKTSYYGQKPIVLLAGFCNNNRLLSYQKHLIKSFQDAGLYVVYIINSDFPEQLSSELTSADHIMIRKNQNYDFGAWATSWLLCSKELYQAKNIFFVNDSIIGPLQSLIPLLKMIAQKKCDVWAITDSQTEQYHFQSFFWGIKKPANQFMPIIDEFFFYRHPLPNDKVEAINLYEIAALTFFVNRKLTVDILFPEHSLIEMAEHEFLNDFEKHFKKWQGFFNLPLKGQLFSQLQGGLVNYTDILMNRLTTNPSHFFWHILIQKNFPFIKKELIVSNPMNYPFPEKFRAVFKESNMEKLLNDMPYANKFTRNI